MKQSIGQKDNQQDKEITDSSESRCFDSDSDKIAEKKGRKIIKEDSLQIPLKQSSGGTLNLQAKGTANFGLIGTFESGNQILNDNQSSGSKQESRVGYFKQKTSGELGFAISAQEAAQQSQWAPVVNDNLNALQNIDSDSSSEVMQDQNHFNRSDTFCVEKAQRQIQKVKSEQQEIQLQKLLPQPLKSNQIAMVEPKIDLKSGKHAIQINPANSKNELTPKRPIKRQSQHMQQIKPETKLSGHVDQTDKPAASFRNERRESQLLRLNSTPRSFLSAKGFEEDQKEVQAFKELKLKHQSASVKEPDATIATQKDILVTAISNESFENFPTSRNSLYGNATHKEDHTMENVFDDFTRFYAETAKKKKMSKFIIMQNNKLKVKWDILIMIIVFFILIFVPYRLAFYDTDSDLWVIIYIFIDICFLIDIILSFLTSLTDPVTHLEITEHSIIAKKYLHSWFFLDVLSIIPIDLLLDEKNLNTIIRFARIGKLQKLIKLVRLVRLFKLMKKKDAMMNQLNEKLQINAGLNRLLFFVFFFIFFIHISACFYVLLADFQEGLVATTWLTGYNHLDDIRIYTLGIYFVCTTVSTVGFGDVSAYNHQERVFCMVLMIIGVSCFSFISGALASIMNSYDSSVATLQEKLLVLNKLRVNTKMNDQLYHDIRRALTFDMKRNREELNDFIQELPIQLRLTLSMHVYSNMFNKYTLFTRIGNSHFLMWVGTNLKPQFLNMGDKVYQEGDDITQFYFMTSGLAAFVQQDQQNLIFAAIDPEKSIRQTGRKKSVFQYFGLEDSVHNHCQLILKIQKGTMINYVKEGEKLLSKRVYTVQVMKSGEALTLTNTALDRMRKQFQGIARKFLKLQIEQFKTLIAFHYLSITHRVFKKKKESETKFNSKFNEQKIAQNFAFNSTVRIERPGFQKTQKANYQLNQQNEIFSELRWSSSDFSSDQGKQAPKIDAESSSLNQSKEIEKKLKQEAQLQKKTSDFFLRRNTSYISHSPVYKRSGLYQPVNYEIKPLGLPNIKSGSRQKSHFVGQRNLLEFTPPNQDMYMNKNFCLQNGSPDLNLNQSKEDIVFQDQNYANKGNKSEVFSSMIKQSQSSSPVIHAGKAPQNNKQRSHSLIILNQQVSSEVNQTPNVDRLHDFSDKSKSKKTDKNHIDEIKEILKDYSVSASHYSVKYNENSVKITKVEGTESNVEKPKHSSGFTSSSGTHFSEDQTPYKTASDQIKKAYENSPIQGKSKKSSDKDKKVWKLSEEEIERAIDMANQAPTGISALANVLLVAQQSKMIFEQQNPGLKAVDPDKPKEKTPRLARLLQRHMRQRINQLNNDLNLRDCLKEFKYELLENLVEEQNFRTKINSLDNNANIEDMFAQHAFRMQELMENMNLNFVQINQKLDDVDQRMSKLEKKSRK